VLRYQNLGLGEAYMDGWWDCPRLDEFFCRVLKSDGCGGKKRIKVSSSTAARHPLHLQSKARDHIVAERHYDLDNDLFLSFLDPYNQYSCAYFSGTDNLEQAQQNKLDLICRKAGLGRNDHVLDIGCGWADWRNMRLKNIIVPSPPSTFAASSSVAPRNYAGACPCAF